MILEIQCELDGLPPSLGGLLNGGEGDEGQYGANSYGSYDGQQSGYDNNKNSFKFVCINNNNNTVIVREEPVLPIPPVVNECEECLGADITVQAAIEGFLVNLVEDFEVSFDEEIIFIPEDVDTIEQLCPLLEGHTDVLLRILFTILVTGQFGAETPESVETLIECLLEAGIIVEGTPPTFPM